MIIFGLMVFKTKISENLTGKQIIVEQQGYLKSLTLGFLGNVFNPLAPLFFISLFAIALSPDTPFYYIVVYGVWMIVLDFSRFILLIKLLSIPEIYNKFQQWGSWVDRILGVTLIVFGVILMGSSINS